MVDTIISQDDPNATPHNLTTSPQYVGFDASNYSAFGTFNPVYRNVWPHLVSCYPATEARMLYFVLTAHIMHANEMGIHWAGIDKLSETCCYGDGTIERAERTLADMEYIKMHFIKDPTSPKRNLPRYQVSPFVMWISHDYIADALDWWWRAIPFKRVRNAVMQYERDNQIQNQNQNQKKNQNQNQMKEPEQNSTNEKAQTRQRQNLETESGDDSSMTSDQTRQRPQKNKHEGEVSLESCKTPLTDQQAEQLAQTIVSNYRTHAPQARQLVASYGTSAVTRAIDDMLVAAQGGFVPAKPVGYLLSQLRKGLYQEKPAKTSTGIYRDFFDG